MAIYAVICSGNFPEGSLAEEERIKLLALWLMRDIRAAKPILKQKVGIEFLDLTI